MNKDNISTAYGFEEWLNLAMRKHPDAAHCHSLTNESDFAGVSLKEARDLAVLGWPEGFKRMQAILQSLEHEIRFPSMQEKITTEIIGSSPDIGAYLRGEPECMFQIESLPSFDRKFARIHVNGAIHCGTSGDAIFWRGAVVIALAHALESAGFGTEITLDYSTRANKYNDEALTVSQFIALKSAGQPIDTDRITFMLANKSAFRRLGFSVMEHAPIKHRQQIGITTHGNYGFPCSLPHPQGADINFEINTSPIHDQLSAAAHVRHLLQTLPQLLEANLQQQQANW